MRTQSSTIATLRQLAKSILFRLRLRTPVRRLVIGSGGVFDPGWIPTDKEQLNLLEESSWKRHLEPESVDAMLAEHVWEHLTIEEGRQAAALCYKYLKPGGYVRLAVPDGLFPDATYREYVDVGGAGGGPNPDYGHKVLYNFRTLSDVFKAAGFEVSLLEYHDESGSFHESQWSVHDGTIHRSRRFDERGGISVILDATKPRARAAHDESSRYRPG